MHDPYENAIRRPVVTVKASDSLFEASVQLIEQCELFKEDLGLAAYRVMSFQVIGPQWLFTDTTNRVKPYGGWHIMALVEFSEIEEGSLR